jgi:spore coat protein U-like protein
MHLFEGKSVVIRVAKRAAAALAGIALVSMAATAAQAQATATTGASVTIADPIAITKTADLSFGTVVPSAAAGTVVVSTSGTRSVTGGVSALGGTITAAAYSVTGYGNSTYSIALPTSVSLTGPTGATAMSASSFAHSADASPALSGGSDSFTVGATLSVGANQAAGTYSGTFDVTVAYN